MTDEITAMDIVYDTFVDEAHIEFVETDLPRVINPRLPFDLHITYNSDEKTWVCEALYHCADEDMDGQCVQIHKEYTSNTIGLIYEMYNRDKDVID